MCTCVCVCGGGGGGGLGVQVKHKESRHCCVQGQMCCFQSFVQRLNGIYQRQGYCERGQCLLHVYFGMVNNVLTSRQTACTCDDKGASQVGVGGDITGYHWEHWHQQNHSPTLCSDPSTCAHDTITAQCTVCFKYIHSKLKTPRFFTYSDTSQV